MEQDQKMIVTDMPVKFKNKTKLYNHNLDKEIFILEGMMHLNFLEEILLKTNLYIKLIYV